MTVAGGRARTGTIKHLQRKRLADEASALDIQVKHIYNSNMLIWFTLGDVGGQLGLVLGASFITLLELIDLFFMWFYFWLRGAIKRRSTRRT